MIKIFEHRIKEAYKDVQGDRSLLWLCSNLMREASELAEHQIKFDGYGKVYSPAEILSEAGDVLNFLAAILLKFNLSLEDAMVDNINKLKERRWIK